MYPELEFLPKTDLKTVKNVIPAVICAHDDYVGCTLAKTYGVELILPFQPDLAVDSQIEVMISANDIALSRHYICGISMQNQIKGRICALIPRQYSVLVQIDCGSIWLANVTLKACRDMNLQEGDSIYCLAKTHAFTYRVSSNPNIYLDRFS